MKHACHGLFLLILVFSCATELEFKQLPAGPIKHHLIVLARMGESVVAQGLASAAPPNTAIALVVNDKHASTISEVDGSFHLALKDVDKKIVTGDFTFTVATQEFKQSYAIRDLAIALSAITKPPFAFDKEVSAISFFNNRVAILSSMASLVRLFAVDEYFRIGDAPSHSILLNKDHPVLLFPSSLAGLHNHVMVSLNLSHEVALLDINKNSVLKKARAKDRQGQLFRTPLSSPLEVSRPMDADESGGVATTITRTTARNPEAIFALDSHHFLVSFTNYFQYEDESVGDKAVVGPGIIVLMALEDNEVTTKTSVILAFKNPRYFVAKNQNEIWVVNAGAFSNIGKKNLTSTNAGLVRIKVADDHDSFAVVNEIALDFAPAPIAVLNNSVVIPEFEGSSVTVIDENASSITEGDKHQANYHQKFGFTFAAPWMDDLVFLGEKSGKLIVFKASKKTFFPFPFIEPIVINKNVHEKIGIRPDMIYFRHQVAATSATSYRPGYTAWLISSTHQRIYPMDFLAVFGP